MYYRFCHSSRSRRNSRRIRSCQPSNKRSHLAQRSHAARDICLRCGTYYLSFLKALISKI